MCDHELDGIGKNLDFFKEQSQKLHPFYYQRFISGRNYRIFNKCAKKYSQDALLYLYEKHNNYRMFSNKKFIKIICKRGFSKIIKLIYNVKKDHELFKSSELFSLMCKGCDLDIVKIMYNFKKDYELIKYDNYLCFTNAFLGNNLEVVKWLYNIKKDNKLIYKLYIPYRRCRTYFECSAELYMFIYNFGINPHITYHLKPEYDIIFSEYKKYEEYEKHNSKILNYVEVSQKKPCKYLMND